MQLRRDVRDIEGNPIVGEGGRREKEVIRVMPEQIREALAEARRRYAEEHAKDDRGLAERADAARDASGSMEKGAPPPFRP